MPTFRARLGSLRPGSRRAHEPVAAWSRALEPRVRTPRAARQAAADRVLGDRPAKAVFDGTLHASHREGTIRGGQDAYDGPLDNTIAEPLDLEHGHDRPPREHARSLGNPLRDGPLQLVSEDHFERLGQLRGDGVLVVDEQPLGERPFEPAPNPIYGARRNGG